MVFRKTEINEPTLINLNMTLINLMLR